ncbi:magnesium/cobalt transporter CorA [Peribacillus simplex]|uniref:Magnesium transport protein CorA n=2 Tax=Peribacillus TaxID=2675229 RepID=A0AA90T300_9BACI|nr:MULTISPECIES: magnesium/cobalt transporter CorA [Peribacillus]MDP1421057.1 magnesium/cobalt transporter CorA [Peribacillus simplex]MDP1453824.1 magnesium/cobalt transporter CorA [Peribacillus frigoritolerans]
MIRTFAVTSDLKLIEDIPLEHLTDSNIKWYWVDFDAPTEEETSLLKTHFNFHPLAIEDCLHSLQRPKLDYYDGYDFFVLHTLNQSSLAPEEVDIFVGHNFIVTFHLLPSNEIGLVRQRVMDDKQSISKGLMYIFYLIMDKIVDGYFPSMYQIEDELNEIELKKGNRDLIGNVYEIRSQLLKLRRTIFPMRELMYRILNSERVLVPKEERVYFMDISDHLLRLSEMIESNREMTADIRDNYISINANRTNNIMKTLTVMTSIFIPLTFIASIYGMNFEYMPELTWHGGYFGVLGVMAIVGFGMLFWLGRMGWFK